MNNIEKEIEIRTDIFKKNLLAEIEDHNISVDKFALLSGVSKTAMKDYVTGIRMPGITNLIAICTCLNLTPDYLLGYFEK